jgi:hypothetical protein
VALLAAEDVHVLDGDRIGGEQERDCARGRAVKSAGESENGKRAQEAPRVDFEIGFHHR